MSEITNRAEAKEASLKKWFDVRERIEKIQTDIDSMCGFCYLAKGKAEGKEPKVFKCVVCEPDARKLCEEYISEKRLILNPLYEAWEKTDNLLAHLRSLPVDLK